MTGHIEYHNPIPSRVTKSRIWAFAEKVRKDVGLKNGFDLVELIKKNNGDVGYIDFLDDDQTDAIIVEPDNSFKIYLSAHTGALRDNFTLAHELGHLLIHWPQVKKNDPNAGMRATRSIDESDDDLRRCEWEANWFASAFLMPEDEFKIAHRKGNAAEKFGVTPAAVEVRAKSLGML